MSKSTNSKATLLTLIPALFNRRTPFYIKGIVLIALCYLVLPLDIIPDFFGLFGLLDDAVVLSTMTTLALSLLNQFNESQASTVIIDD